MKEKIIRFMNGRYGVDEMNRYLLGGGVVCIFLSMLFRRSIFGMILDWLGFAAVIYCYVRMLSKDIYKRQSQNIAFVAKKNKVKSFFAGKIWMLKQQKEYHIYKCPQCGQKIRIPRGKGKISITCPKCKNSFIKKS